jgi:hypothetical protein
MLRILGLTALFGLSQAASAAGTAATPTLATVTSAGHAASPAVTQRVREEMHQTLLRLATTGALGAHPEQTALDIDVPAQRSVNLGLLVDATSAANAHDGLRVLGTTPDSTAERLGVRPGDVIVAVNGHSLRELGADASGRALAAATLKSNVDALPADAAVQLDVRRGGSQLALNGPLQSVQLPALHVVLGAATLAAVDAGAQMPAPSGGCGRISLQDLAPRQQQLFGASIEIVDGTTPGPTGAKNYRVSAGTHQLLVREQIPTRRLVGVSELAALNFRSKPKPLTITVKPNTTVMIAAHFNEQRTNEFSSGGYWDPVVWKEVEESCP